MKTPFLGGCVLTVSISSKEKKNARSGISARAKAHIETGTRLKNKGKQELERLFLA
jgi:hypothetical protein